MPLIEQSSYKASFFYKAKHFSTIFPSVFRKVDLVLNYERERISTPDNDFLNLDWLKTNLSKKLVVLTHGLEGDSKRTYIKGMANIFYENGYDILAWNCRTCGGEMNINSRMYSHANFDDLETVINHIVNLDNYSNIHLVGFSMGANITLNYLAKTDKIPSVVSSSVVFSAPVILSESAKTLDYKSNLFYNNKFKKSLWSKILSKEKQYPGIINKSDLVKVKKWRDFDHFFSAKINGFKSAEDFYENGSPHNFLDKIKQPVLIVNAINDPLLTPRCSPLDFAKKSNNIYLENPKYGGHVGFYDNNNHIWSERRALEFIESKA